MYSTSEFLKAIDKSGGYVSLIAERVGCAPKTVYKWISKDEDVREAIEKEKLKQIDHAEGKLQSLIQKENPTAIIFYLKTQGKDRGYVERQEVAGVAESPLSFRWTEGDD